MFWNFILFYFIKVETDPRLQYKNERRGLEDAINSAFNKYVEKKNTSCNNFPDEARAELSWDFTLQDKRAKVPKKQPFTTK